MPEIAGSIMPAESPKEWKIGRALKTRSRGLKSMRAAS